MTRRGDTRTPAGVVRRVVDFRPELRAAQGADGPIGVTGHAAVFDRDSLPLWDWWEGAFIERIRPGAFTKTLQEADVRMLINHDQSLVLARNTAGTLRLSEDEIGLLVDAEMAPTSYARDLAVSLARGDVNQMSFAFRIVKESWTTTHEGLPLRNVEEAALSDVSIVTYPAYPDTDAGLRSRYDAVMAEIAGAPTPERYPLLRAAQGALATLIGQLEPPPGHSARAGDAGQWAWDQEAARVRYEQGTSAMNEAIKRLREERAALWEQMKGLYAGAEGEKRGPTAEERERWGKLNAELDEKTRELQALEAHERRTTELETVRRDPRLLPGGDRGATPNDETRRREEYREAFLGYLRGGLEALEPDQRRTLRGGFVQDETRVQNKTTTTAGGFTVPQDFYDQLVVHLIQAGAMRQTRATVITSAEGRDLPVPKTTAHGAAAWIAESGPITAADDTFGQVVLKAYKAGRSIRVSNELLTDTGVDLVAYLARELGRSIGALENTAYVVGVGTTQPTGVTTLTTLGKTGLAGQTLTVISDDLFDLYYAVSPPYRRLGEWLMNDGSLKAVRKLKDSTGQFLWSPGLTGGEPDMLLGKPVYSDPDMPAMGVSAKSILFGDFSTYFIRDVGQLTVRRSDEIYIATDEVGFFGLHRTDGNLIDQTGAIRHYANSAT